MCYRFPFDTFFLAGFTDCGLLELHLLDTFSYVSLRDSYATIFQMDKLVVDIESHTLLLIISTRWTWTITTQFHNTVALPIKLVYEFIGRRGMRLNISTFWVEPIHRLPARLVIGLLLTFTRIFRLEKLMSNKYSIYPYGTHTINLIHIPTFLCYYRTTLMIPTPPILTSAVALCPKARHNVLGFPLNSL